jgi:carboxylate-amine ligase
MIELCRPHAEKLGCIGEVEASKDILKEGNSSTRQRRVYAQSIEQGADQREALKEVVRLLIGEFSQGL